MQLSLVGDRLLIDLEWYEQLWAFTLTKTFSIPLEHVQGVSTEEPLSTWAEIRAPGTFLPGVIKAGTYYTNRGREFWYVTADKNYLTLELQDEPYRRIVLTVEQSADWTERLRQALSRKESD